jgi:hypothetical protein
MLWCCIECYAASRFPLFTASCRARSMLFTAYACLYPPSRWPSSLHAPHCLRLPLSPFTLAELAPRSSLPRLPLSPFTLAELAPSLHCLRLYPPLLSLHLLCFSYTVNLPRLLSHAPHPLAHPPRTLASTVSPLASHCSPLTPRLSTLAPRTPRPSHALDLSSPPSSRHLLSHFFHPSYLVVLTPHLPSNLVLTDF